jgi:hypothetical protein
MACLNFKLAISFWLHNESSADGYSSVGAGKSEAWMSIFGWI